VVVRHCFGSRSVSVRLVYYCQYGINKERKKIYLLLLFINPVWRWRPFVAVVLVPIPYCSLSLKKISTEIIKNPEKNIPESCRLQNIDASLSLLVIRRCHHKNSTLKTDKSVIKKHNKNWCVIEKHTRALSPSEHRCVPVPACHLSLSSQE
jgi:hypothetical protein